MNGLKRGFFRHSFCSKIDLVHLVSRRTLESSTKPPLMPTDLELNELARKHVPLYPTEEIIKARSWDKPQWERHVKDVSVYGLDAKDPISDVQGFHFNMFITVTTTFMLIFIYRYYPDFRQREWYRREAFLELARRESAGLPLIDPNYIPVDKIVLPDESELEGIEIVI